MKGCEEILHNQIESVLFDEYERKDKFIIDASLVEAISYHNNIVHIITKYESNVLRNINDISLFEKVVNNIISNIFFIFYFIKFISNYKKLNFHKLEFI